MGNPITKFETQKNWDVEINGKKTFFYILDSYYSEVSRYWRKDSTRKTYNRDYDDYLLNYVNAKPLEDYNLMDFEAAIQHVGDDLVADKRVFNDATRQHFKVLIRRVTSTAQRAKICEDILWGTTYGKELNEANKKPDSKLRRSLTEREELLAADYLLSDPKQAGNRFGLALMFCEGMRDNEAAAILFGDIRPMTDHPAFSVVRVYKSKVGNSEEDKLSGKTRNANRYLPLAGKLDRLIRERREVIKDAILRGEVTLDVPLEDDDAINRAIDRLYVACKGNDYTSGCATTDLIRASHALFRDIVKMDEAIVRRADEERAQINIEMLSQLRETNGDEADALMDEVVERDPTAYLLRRNFATRLYHMGLNESEIQYIMGHDIVDTSEKRAYFRNEEKLSKIAEKMKKRYAVNEVEPTVTVSAQNEAVQTVRNAYSVVVDDLRPNTMIRIESYEAPKGPRVKAKKTSGDLAVSIRQFPTIAPTPESVNVQSIIAKRYASAALTLDNKASKSDENEEKQEPEEEEFDAAEETPGGEEEEVEENKAESEEKTEINT